MPGVAETLYRDYVIESPQPLDGADTISPILQVTKLRLHEIN